MIKYKLKCNDCDLIFDSWFASSKEFEKLKKKRLLECHICNSSKVDKTLMSPRVINKKEKIDIGLQSSQRKNIKKTLQDYQKFIKDNFEYVGENFAHKARSIHYDENKKSKGIYGTASNKDIVELNEEGIETQFIPWVDHKKN